MWVKDDKSPVWVIYSIEHPSLSVDELTAFTQDEEVMKIAFDFSKKLNVLWTSREAQKAPASIGESPVEFVLNGMEMSSTADTSASKEQIGSTGQENEGSPAEALSDEPDKSKESRAEVTQAPAEAGKAPAAAAGTGTDQMPALSDNAIPSKAIFSLPNAKAGQDYVGVPKYQGKEDAKLSFRNFKMPDGLGLEFDADEGTVKGTPKLAGEQRLDLEWSSDRLKWFTGSTTLLVNPDPKSLWKVLEPPADAPYRKSHTDGQTIDCGEFKITVGSRRGRSHEHTGGFRDDDFWISNDAESGWSVIVVCDGAGSAKSSRWGSMLAASTGGERLMKELTGEAGMRISLLLDGSANQEVTNEVGKEFYRIYPEMAMECVKAIEDEAASKKAVPRDYSTTMLAVALRRRGEDTFLATFWMGDGAIGVYGPRGKVRLMGTPDSGEFVGQTRFLDRAAVLDQNVYSRINVGRYKEVVAVMAMTDGISDPYFETDSGMAEAKNWDNLWDAISPCLASGSPEDALIEWMDFLISGHHDDRTLAVLW